LSLKGGRDLDLRGWLVEQQPPVPEAFLRLVDAEVSSASGRPLAEALLGLAREALRDALAGEGERRGAYRLLAADAYVTYACDVALDSRDPTAALEQVVEGVVAEAEVG
jgi:hypothetical protein